MAPQPDTFPDSDQFLEAARRGDARAWEQLVSDYSPYLLAVAKRTLANRPADEHSSVVQEGLLRAFDRVGQFQGRTRAELLGWLSRIVANKAIDRINSPRPQPIPVGSSGGELLPGLDATPSSQIERRERAALVVQAMERLPEDYREVVHQRAFLDLDYDEIAARMGRTNEAVRWLWVRAVRRLRKELGEES